MPPVHIVGAGIIGVSVAAHLIRRGRDVVLIDPAPPGREASFGNAGVISRGSVLPPNGPEIWRALPGYALNRSPALRYDAKALPRLAPWIARFLAGATPRRCAATAAALDGLLKGALAAHEELMELARCGHRLRRTGYLKVFRSDATFHRNAGERATLDRFAIAHTVLDAAGLRALEPHLSAVFRHGVLVGDSASVDDPGAVTSAYADLVCDAGAGLVTARVRGLTAREGGYTLHTDRAGDIAAETVVVAAGAWSGGVLGHLGLRVPLAAERGYHRRFAFAGSHRLARPFHDVEGHYVMTCMDGGVQISTGIELAAVDAPSTDRQLAAAEAMGRTAFAFGPPVAPPWRGARPGLPDGRPMIGAVPGRPGLWCAFGHGHIGFTTGPATGRLLAEQMATGQVPDVLAPFAPARYLRG